MKKRFLRWFAVLALLVGGSAGVFGTPTGLNNIPTADTVPDRTVAWQGFLNLGGPNAVNGVPGYGPTGRGTLWSGFKTGLRFSGLRLEWGLDTPILPGQAGPLAFQTKLGFNPWENGSVVVGVANVALTDTRRSAEPFTYGVLTQDFGLLRVHAGYGYQAYGQAGIGSSSLLAGVDRTFKVWERDLNLNADVIQTERQHAWLPAVGAKYNLSQHIVLEAWGNFPEHGKASGMAKINYVFTY